MSLGNNFTAEIPNWCKFTLSSSPSCRLLSIFGDCCQRGSNGQSLLSHTHKPPVSNNKDTSNSISARSLTHVLLWRGSAQRVSGRVHMAVKVCERLTRWYLNFSATVSVCVCVFGDGGVGIWLPAGGQSEVNVPPQRAPRCLSTERHVLRDKDHRETLIGLHLK